MSKRILIVSTSPRKGGNSDALAEEFARGAREAGHEVEKVCLYDKTINFCKGCLSCQSKQDGHCFQRDDADEIVGRMAAADTVVFATPIYFYEMCGQMKALLDRTNPLFPVEYAFRDIYLLTAAADTGDTAMDGAQRAGGLDFLLRAGTAGRERFRGGRNRRWQHRRKSRVERSL